MNIHEIFQLVKYAIAKGYDPNIGLLTSLNDEGSADEITLDTAKGIIDSAVLVSNNRQLALLGLPLPFPSSGENLPMTPEQAKELEEYMLSHNIMPRNIFDSDSTTISLKDAKTRVDIAVKIASKALESARKAGLI